MTVIAQDQRMAELRRLGASAPLMRLAAGECLHEAFRDGCLGPARYVDHGAKAPEGPPWIPLWGRGTRVSGARQRSGGLEFIEFSIEAPDAFDVVAGTEQGFWATRFDFLHELDMPDDVLRQAASLVGFRFLDRYLDAREAAEEQLATFSAHRQWLREMVSRIDDAHSTR